VGCLGACTYCKTKHARGHLGSYPVQSLVARLRSVIADGVKEIWLSSEDTGAYGKRHSVLGVRVWYFPVPGEIAFES
jgi:threonylcarbamoyladenosine tRNA methylthiotransferase CDKAL1